MLMQPITISEKRKSIT